MITRMENKEAEILLRKYLQGLCTDEEAKIVEDTYDLHMLQHVAKSSDQTLEQVHRSTWSDIERRTSRTRRRYFNLKWSAAAAVLLFFGASYYLLVEKGIDSVPKAHFSDFEPGKNRAYITLSSGEHLDLDSSQASLITKDGRYTYGDGTELLSFTEAEFATVQTPRAGHYQIYLPDGTGVWLNSESSIEYPTRFETDKRQVILKGEAYFDVAHKPDQPFVIQTPEQEIKVLGTKFSVRAYDKVEYTTLISGKVEVRSSHSTRQYTLEPGKQALLDKDGIHIREVNVEEYIGWMQGRIVGMPISLKRLIPEIERWYDVNFSYNDSSGLEEKAYININRNENLSTVLKALEATYEVKFNIRGKEVNISKKK